jgi:hypothetical protein
LVFPPQKVKKQKGIASTGQNPLGISDVCIHQLRLAQTGCSELKLGRGCAKLFTFSVARVFFSQQSGLTKVVFDAGETEPCGTLSLIAEHNVSDMIRIAS